MNLWLFQLQYKKHYGSNEFCIICVIANAVDLILVNCDNQVVIVYTKDHKYYYKTKHKDAKCLDAPSKSPSNHLIPNLESSRSLSSWVIPIVACIDWNKQMLTVSEDIHSYDHILNVMVAMLVEKWKVWILIWLPPLDWFWDHSPINLDVTRQHEIEEACLIEQRNNVTMRWNETPTLMYLHWDRVCIRHRLWPMLFLEEQQRIILWSALDLDKSMHLWSHHSY